MDETAAAADQSAIDPEGTLLTGESQQVSSALPQLPGAIGRYRIERLLGQGGFGLVFLGYDDQLMRQVAIKVPHRRFTEQVSHLESYLTEARTVASLDHPHIVPVFDVGRTDEFPCFVVSKFVDGIDLATRLRQSRLTLRESVDLIAASAEALHHAHKHGLVHRDIKPANILLDKKGKSFVADFGLALREEDLGSGPRFAGTPVYMSPEQARGEGHRVDGRSDVFSLGIVFYELLTGKRPFASKPNGSFLEQTSSYEVRPPRQVDDTIPKELERICLKSLSKRASERYTTAGDMAAELRQYLAGATTDEKATLTGVAHSEQGVDTPVRAPESTLESGSPVRIVPKGLRSFDAGDANFFLELLPGPQDRYGLPESIRFWKSRIEITDDENTFSVGLLYGPSGCGKSSLVKAGLLPILDRSILAVHIEATAHDTEARLLKSLRRLLPELPDRLGLVETLTVLRRGHTLAPGQKVLIILDQFEQWLHANRNTENTTLVDALRHCDGEKLQCLIMVRDDFWLAISRFMKALEVGIVEGRNSALVDLFDPIHARKVLVAFGHAYGRLPDSLSQFSADQEAFVSQAVAGLAQEGKINCVRLALFAEMVKGKPWTPATLKQVGGTQGVGFAFLEETFHASTAPPHHRLHQKAAQAVLKALLPEAGTLIRGHMRSHLELQQASGYNNRLNDFDELLRILDKEIRLITPTDPEGKNFADEPAEYPGDEKYYQLTHDYLVTSLRDWLTRKQKETRRGRADILLAERATAWNALPESRHLPSFWEYLNILTWTKAAAHTPPQRRMLRVATRVHGIRWGLALMALLVIGTIVVRSFLAQLAYEAAQKFENDRQRVTYLNRVGLAFREWQDGNTLRTKQLLDDCPRPLRGWEWRYVDRLLSMAETTFTQHRGSVRPGDLSPIGTTVVTGDDNGAVYLWDAKTGEQQHELGSHQGGCWGAVFSPDGACVATCGGDGMIRLWDVQTGQQKWEVAAHTGCPNGVAFSPDGLQLASIAGDMTYGSFAARGVGGTAVNEAKLWDVKSGIQVRRIGLQVAPLSLSYDRKGEHLAIGHVNGSIELFDDSLGTKIRGLMGSGQVWSVAFNSDGTNLVTAHQTNQAALWNVADGARIMTLAHPKPVRGATFGADGMTVVSACDDSQIRVWDQSGALLRSIRGHSGIVNRVVASRDGNLILSCGHDLTARIWDARSDQQFIAITGHRSWVTGMFASRDEAFVASVGRDGGLRFWSPATGRTAAPEIGGASNVWPSVAISKDGTTIALSASDNAVELWDCVSHLRLQRLQGHTDCVDNLVFSADGQYLASASFDRTIRLWDLQTGEARIRVRRNKGELSSKGLAFSPDSKLLIYGDAATVVKWDLAADQTTDLLGHTRDVTSAAFSPDGKRLATSSIDHSVRLWDPSTALELVTCLGHSDMVHQVVFSPDGGRLASVSEDTTIRVWLSETGEEALTLRGASPLYCITYLADGERLATGDAQGGVRIWNAKRPLAGAEDGIRLPEVRAEEDQSRHLDLVIARLRKAIKLNSGSAEDYLHLASLLKAKQDFKGAVAAFREAVRISPMSSMYQNNLADALMLNGELDEALQCIAVALELDPQNAIAHATLAEIQIAKGNGDLAAAAAEEALRLQPEWDAIKQIRDAALKLKAHGKPKLDEQSDP